MTLAATPKMARQETNVKPVIFLKGYRQQDPPARVPNKTQTKIKLGTTLHSSDILMQATNDNPRALAYQSDQTTTATRADEEAIGSKILQRAFLTRHRPKRGKQLEP